MCVWGGGGGEVAYIDILGEWGYDYIQNMGEGYDCVENMGGGYDYAENM